MNTFSASSLKLLQKNIEEYKIKYGLGLSFSYKNNFEKPKVGKHD